MRICKDCGACESEAKWVTKHGKLSGLLCLKCTAARRKAYLASNPIALANAHEATATWIQSNLEHRRSKCRAYYHKPEVKAKILASRKLVSEDLRNIWRSRCRAWNAKNLSYKSAATRLYRLTKTKHTAKWLTPEDHKQMHSMYELARIITECTGEKYHVDHIIPLRGRIVSGLHVPYNLQVIRASINIRKSNKYEEDCKATA